MLILASKIFKGFYIQSFGYAINGIRETFLNEPNMKIHTLMAVLVIICGILLSSTVKPFLKLIFLPVTVITTGIFYPFINVIILKLASLIMGDAFVVEGWILPFFIALFISFTTLILDKLITKNVIGE